MTWCQILVLALYKTDLRPTKTGGIGLVGCGLSFGNLSVVIKRKLVPANFLDDINTRATAGVLGI